VLLLQVRGPRQATMVSTLARAAHPGLWTVDVVVVSSQRAVVELVRI
jgi:hypothetical protein